MKRIYLLLAAVLTAIFLASVAFAYTIPENNSAVKYFYVFGPQGNPDLGADLGTESAANTQTIYIDVPKDEPKPVTINIYDPDTGGFRDLKPILKKDWGTTTEFAVYGKANSLLDKKEFGNEKKYDRNYFQFGPYEKEQGEDVGTAYRFTLTVKTLSGEDENLFNVKISPESSEAFSYKIAFRLLPEEGSKMFFYPQVSAEASQIIVYNYDLDKHGGTAQLYDVLAGKKYKIQDSLSAEWTETPIQITASGQARRLEYIITKETQKYANAAVRVTDAEGKGLPIYFEPSKQQRYARKPAPVIKAKPVPEPPLQPKREVVIPPKGTCNTFVFDATESYDPDGDNLTFLWDFGDGSSSTEPVVTHSFDKGGEYTVTLTVTDSSTQECSTSTTTQKVWVNTSPAAAFDAPERACINQDVAFDASATVDETSANLSYKWDFGDGTTADGKQAIKAYKKGGEYTVTLIVDDHEGTPCSSDSIQKKIKLNTPPTIEAGKDLDICVTFGEAYNVTLSAIGNDPDGDNLNYAWDLGDGTTAEGKSVTHTYAKGGAYTATVKVDDSSGLSCASAQDSVNIKLNMQPKAEAGIDLSTCVGSEVNFDASASLAEEGAELNYSWDFGDGSRANGRSVSHSYKKGGTYKAMLTVDDGKNSKCSTSSDSLEVTVNASPVASLSEPSIACIGATVEFDASGSKDPDGDALSYTWDFGDGTVSAGEAKATHIYEKGGNYTVKVTVDDKKSTPCSADSAIQNVRINTAPVANAGPNLVCCTGTKSNFDGSASSDADGDELSYKWDFGDGSKADGVKAQHVYKSRGTYNVTLTVDDNSKTACSSSSASFIATTTEQPVSVIKVKQQQ